MKRRSSLNVPKFLTLSGVVLFLASLIWWQQTFGLDVDVLKCLVVTGGICNIGGIGKFFGGTPYNPIIFWVAIGCLGAGFYLKRKG